MSKAVGYGRMSTDKQQLSPQVQEKKIRAWFAAQQAAGCYPEHEFSGMVCDHAVSSRINMLLRPEGEKLLTELERGDMVIVASLTRAFRSAADAESTMEKFEEAGLTMVILDMQVDTSTPVGKLFLSLLAACAKFERDMISERTSDALQVRRRQGKPYGQPCIGWKISHRNLVPDPLVRHVAESCLDLFGKGFSREEVFRVMRRSLRKRKMAPITELTCVNYAVAACLGFPKTVGLTEASKALGQSIQNLTFVREADHKDAKRKLRMYTLQQGLEYE